MKLIPRYLLFALLWGCKSRDMSNVQASAEITDKTAGCQVIDMSQDDGVNGKLLNGTARFAALNDPVAKILLKDGKCPTGGFGDIQRRIDTVAGSLGCKKNSIITDLISETVNQTSDLSTPLTNVRAIVRRDELRSKCSDNLGFRLLISLGGGLSGNSTATDIDSHAVELIGFQPTSTDGKQGVFNFYSLEDLSSADGKGPKQWRYFGSSQDFVANQEQHGEHFDGTGGGKFPLQVRGNTIFDGPFIS